MTIATFSSSFEHRFQDIEELRDLLSRHGVQKALLKVLPKNANDKNQVYVASDFGLLFDSFAMTFTERGSSTSMSKPASSPGRRITEAAFDEFHWLKPGGELVRAKRVKAIVYPQYPEARLSGFQTIEGDMPAAMSVTWTKENPEEPRLLVLGCRKDGSCIALLAVDLSDALMKSLKKMRGTDRARAWKMTYCKPHIERLPIDRIISELAPVVSHEWLGSRLDTMGNVLPFKGTQVCGYTLERALGITPNSSKDGDLYGIELKTFTSNRLTLFTPEPDLGLYAQDFATFMRRYGYRDGNGNYRLTGTHRAGVVCPKSQLRLEVVEYQVEPETGEWIMDELGNRVPFPYNPERPLSGKVDALEVLLFDPHGNVAAGWSFERLMNCWGAKHNHVVYVPAEKEKLADDDPRRQDGYEFTVRFSNRALIGEGTSAENLFLAIAKGIIYLDPAPKLMGEGGQHKRRSQWRVGDIRAALDTLYERHREWVFE
ncbi:hypothetical protein CVH10_08710 [Halomonas sp. ND22Bw]|uniref:MvaI/BcnI family restriction endonuclease n=1 Tax=Halomonas sp. ND22Bw TaxID=2054178 RepID=UPI000D0B9813|nr:hypothetical protein CVH10_08710 [Halomonas sp. ND22Bw]